MPSQMRMRLGDFGRNYTERNMMTPNGLDRLYIENFGVTRTKLNNLFIGRLNRNLRILEVGSNIGIQLLLLQRMGFKNLYGIEINKYALELAKKRNRNINFIYSSVFDIPFRDKYFDLVFTSVF